MKHAKKILNFLSAKKTSLSPLLILTHDYPDPDALAGAFALHYLAENVYGIRARIAYGGIVGRMENRAMVSILRLPIHKVKPSDFRKFNSFALIDTQPDFENNSFPNKRKANLVIDQHASVSKPLADLAVIDTDCGATCVLLAQALLLLDIKIPANVATALAYGILSDTLNLYRAKRHDVIETYLDILKFCDMKMLARIQNPLKPRKFFATLGKAIQNAFVREKLIVSHLKEVENPDLVSQVADFLLTYKGMQWAICTGHYKDKLYVSFRITNPKTDAGEVLRDVFTNPDEAGGHDSIAGGSFYMGGATEEKWQEAEQSLIERLQKRLRIPLKSEPYFPFR